MKDNLEKQLKNREDLLLLKILELDELQTKIREIRDERDAIKLKLNKDNLKTFGWCLQQHPDEPGVYRAIHDTHLECYGGEYNPITVSGYYSDKDYTCINSDVSLSLRDYGGKNKFEEYLENFKNFIRDNLEYLIYTEDLGGVSVVPFQYRSESYGLSYLGVDKETMMWYEYSMVYGRVSKNHEFKTLEEALGYAYKESQESEEDDTW